MPASFPNSLIGDFFIPPRLFSSVEDKMLIFDSSIFQTKNSREKWNQINGALLELIEREQAPCFLLSAVLDYIKRINEKQLVTFSYRFSHFELWLNHCSELSLEKNLEIRAKIAGKQIPRDDFQLYFPIGMTPFYGGSHLVVAHLSPDVDTMVASFWGWLDAFTAKIGTGIHRWCLPSGAPDAPFVDIFKSWMGDNVIEAIASTEAQLTLTASDFLSPLGEVTSIDSWVELSASLEEIQAKATTFGQLTVCLKDAEDTLIPIGSIDPSDLHKYPLATVSFRDFSNFDEVKMDSGFALISVIDHHKCALKTAKVSTVSIDDVQSCNVILAEKAFAINDSYSKGGLQANPMLENPHLDLTNASTIRLYRRFLQRTLAALQPHWWIDHAREYFEYYCFLQAILDDTDLLSKVSQKDVNCIVELLNRLKSLSVRKEVEIANWERDAPHSRAEKLLQNGELYSIYKKIFHLREESVNTHLEKCHLGELSNLFLDTKEQNGCARIGQTKLFMNNFPLFARYHASVWKQWIRESEAVNRKKPQIDLYIHMISTITSADEVYHNQIGPYSHKDELWFWIPATERALKHLNTFLTQFSEAIGPDFGSVAVDYSLSTPSTLVSQLKGNFRHATFNQMGTEIAEGVGIRLLFEPGKVNSRKTMISPFLPTPAD